MTSSIANIIQSLRDGGKAIIKLIDQNGNFYHCECLYKEDKAPHFFLVFPPDTLPQDIDKEKNHPVIILRESSSLSLSTSIVGKINDRTLHLIANATLDPSCLREYFRINTSTRIIASYRAGSLEDAPADWTLSGQTQDISGSGALALFNEEPKNSNHIVVEIILPHKNITVNAVSHIIRKKQLRNRRWQVSFHFDSISTKHRDAIITYLLSVQRQQLRENVHARDQ